jgi:hypothetical protein
MSIFTELKKDNKKSTYLHFKLTTDEMMLFICVLLLLGITCVHSYRKEWNTHNAQFIVRLNELMTGNRFKVISSFFHVITPEEEERT